MRWRSLGAQFFFGGVLGLIALALPPREDHVTTLLVIGLWSTLTGVALVALARRLPVADWPLAAALAASLAAITIAVVAAGRSSTVYGLLYVWIGFYAFYFFRGTVAYGFLVLVAGASALGFALTPAHGDGRTGRWLVTAGTVLLACVLAELLRERSERLIAQLSDAARRDPLTGLLNRRGFEQQFAEELERARRLGTGVSVVIGDLDHFKVVNDQFGHERGDEALRDFARLAEDSVRRIDAVSRFGGEEFAIVLPGTGAHGAFLLAERLRLRTRRELTGYVAGGLSASFGVAAYPQHGQTVPDLVRHADEALYLAKRRGRDRTAVYDADVAGPHDAPGAPEETEHLPAVLVLAETLDIRQSGTPVHHQAVGRYAESTAVEMGFGPARAERVRLAGLLHDIGKIGIPDAIVRKPDPLTDEEWEEMRRHPELGARILAGANLADIGAWVLAHHERLDGNGYPAGLVNGSIPIESRILAVADSFEAMTTDRAYRAGMTPEEAARELRRCAGTQFDPEVVDAFLEAQARYRAASDAATRRPA